MLRLIGLVVMVALPQPSLVKPERVPLVAALSRRPVAPVSQSQGGAVDPVDVVDDGDDLDGGGHDGLNVGAALAALLVPSTPSFAVKMPSGARAAVLWSRAIQECGPPRA